MNLSEIKDIYPTEQEVSIYTALTSAQRQALHEAEPAKAAQLHAGEQAVQEWSDLMAQLRSGVLRATVLPSAAPSALKELVSALGADRDSKDAFLRSAVSLDNSGHGRDFERTVVVVVRFEPTYLPEPLAEEPARTPAVPGSLSASTVDELRSLAGAVASHLESAASAIEDGLVGNSLDEIERARLAITHDIEPRLPAGFHCWYDECCPGGVPLSE